VSRVTAAGLAVLLWLAAPALAVEQPIIGNPILDPTEDVPALQQSIGLSVTVQSLRHGSVITGSLLSADALLPHIDTTSTPHATALRTSVTTDYACATLAAANLTARLWGAISTWSARDSLADALVGFSWPFVVGSGLDMATAFLGYRAAIDLLRTRAAHGVSDGLSTAWRIAEIGHLATAILATTSAVSGLLVGVTATDLLVFERRRLRGPTTSAAIVPGPGSFSLIVRF